MHPVLVRIFGIPIYSYGFMLAVSFLVCIVLMLRRSPRAGIAPHHILDLNLFIIIAGILGARSLHVIEQWDYYSQNPLEIIMLPKGGLSFQGGFIAAVLVGLIVAKLRRLPLGKTMDLFVLYLPLGIAIGRIGCYFNGCCYGEPAGGTAGIIFPAVSSAAQKFGADIPVYFTQLYSSAANLCIFIVLMYIYRSRKRRPGSLLIYYLCFYGISRFLIEFYRGDNPIVRYGLTVPQFISLLMIAVSLA